MYSQTEQGSRRSHNSAFSPSVAPLRHQRLAPAHPAGDGAPAACAGAHTSSTSYKFRLRETNQFVPLLPGVEMQPAYFLPALYKCILPNFSFGDSDRIRLGSALGPRPASPTPAPPPRPCRAPRPRPRPLPLLLLASRRKRVSMSTCRCIPAPPRRPLLPRPWLGLSLSGG